MDDIEWLAQPYTLMSFTITSGKITRIDAIADPAPLRAITP
jgi:hypothetical protein